MAVHSGCQEFCFVLVVFFFSFSLLLTQKASGGWRMDTGIASLCVQGADLRIPAPATD